MAKSTSQFRIAFSKARKKCQISPLGTWQEWWRLLNWLDDDTILRLGHPPKMWRSYKKIHQIEIFSKSLIQILLDDKDEFDLLTSSRHQRLDEVHLEILADNTKLWNYLPETVEDETLLRGISTFHEVIAKLVRDLVQEDHFLRLAFGLPSSWEKLSDLELFQFIQEFILPVFEDTEPSNFRFVERAYKKEGHSLFLCITRGDQSYMTCVSKDIAFRHDIPHQITQGKCRSIDEDLLWREFTARFPFIPHELQSWDIPEVEITENSIPLEEWDAIPLNNRALIAAHLTGAFNRMVQIPLDHMPKSFWEILPTEIQACFQGERLSREEQQEFLNAIRDMMLFRRESPNLGDDIEIPPEEEGYVFPFTWASVCHIVDRIFETQTAQIEKVSPYLEKQIDILLSVKTEGAGSAFLDVALGLIRVLKQVDDGDIEDFYSSKRGFNFTGSVRSILQQLKDLTEQCRNADQLFLVIAAVREVREVCQEQEVKTLFLILHLFQLLYLAVSFSFGPREYVCGAKDGELLTRPVLPLISPFRARFGAGEIVPFLLHLDEYGDAFHQVFEENLILSNFSNQKWEKLPSSYMSYASNLVVSKPDLLKPVVSHMNIEGCSIKHIIFIDGQDENTIYLRVDTDKESSFYRLQRGIDWHLTNLLDRTQINNEWVFVLACCHLHDMKYHPNATCDRRRLPATPFDMVERSNAAQEGAFDSSLDLFFDLNTD